MTKWSDLKYYQCRSDSWSQSQSSHSCFISCFVKYLLDQGIKFVVSWGGAVCRDVERAPFCTGFGVANVVGARVGGVVETEFDDGACWPPLGCRPTLPARIDRWGRVLASADVDNIDSEDSSAMVDTLPTGWTLKINLITWKFILVFIGDLLQKECSTLQSCCKIYQSDH